MPPLRPKLGTILLEMGVVDALQLRSALAHHQQWGVPLGQALLDKRLCSASDLMEALSKQTGLPRLDLDAQDLDPALASLLPLKTAQKLRAVPLRLEGKRGEVLVVAIAAPANMEALDTLRNVAGKQRVAAWLVSDDAVDRAIGELYRGIQRMSAPAEPTVYAQVTTVDNESTFELEVEAEAEGDDGHAPAEPRAASQTPLPARATMAERRPESSVVPRLTPSPLAARAEPPSSPPKVWLLGWHDARERALLQMLNQANLRATTLPEDALERCADPDVVISTTLTLQTLLPPGSGLPHGRLIICGMAQDADLAEAKAMGAKMYLRPPFSSEKLARAVMQVGQR